MGLYRITFDIWWCVGRERMELNSGFPLQNQSFAETNRRIAKAMVSDYINTIYGIFSLYDLNQASLNELKVKFPILET